MTSGQHSGRGAHGTAPGGDRCCIRLPPGEVSGAGVGSGMGAGTRLEEVDAVKNDIIQAFYFVNRLTGCGASWRFHYRLTGPTLAVQLYMVLPSWFVETLSNARAVWGWGNLK